LSPSTSAPEIVLGRPYSKPADIWSAGTVAFTALSVRRPFEAPTSPQILEQSRLGMVPVLLATSAVLRVLRNATLRSRLSGTTFRVLALANVAAFSVVLYHITFQLWRLLFGLPGPLRNLPIYPVCIAMLAQFAAFYAVRASYCVLEEEGLPSFGRPRLKNVLAFGYALTMTHQVVWGGGLLLYSNLKTTGALRCFVLAACAYVCQTAAVAGPRRLASDTYKTLNVVLCIDSALRLATALRAESISLGTAATVALPAVALASSAGGWLVGKFAKK